MFIKIVLGALHVYLIMKRHLRSSLFFPSLIGWLILFADDVTDAYSQRLCSKCVVSTITNRVIDHQYVSHFHIMFPYFSPFVYSSYPCYIYGHIFVMFQFGHLCGNLRHRNFSEGLELCKPLENPDSLMVTLLKWKHCFFKKTWNALFVDEKLDTKERPYPWLRLDYIHLNYQLKTKNSNNPSFPLLIESYQARSPLKFFGGYMYRGKAVA